MNREQVLEALKRGHRWTIYAELSPDDDMNERAKKDRELIEAAMVGLKALDKPPAEKRYEVKSDTLGHQDAIDPSLRNSPQRVQPCHPAPLVAG